MFLVKHRGKLFPKSFIKKKTNAFPFKNLKGNELNI